jgi:ABC-2 type transport system ATP-binding protein
VTIDESPLALRITGLSKSYGRPAVEQLDLSVRRGELYALLGPNGAGKTTTLRMVAGLVAPDSGRIEVLGVDLAQAPRDAKRRLAYLPDDPMLYGKLKPTEYLEFVAGLWGVKAAAAEARARELLDWLDLSAHAHELTEGFSRGMKQKLALAGALIHDPELLILDEPLTGLDASAARQVKDLLLSHVAKGGTVILTTHILEVAERLAQRIGIIRQGRLIAEGTLDELRERTSGGSLEDVFLQLTSQS